MGEPLKEYDKKRNFKKTKEPSGRIPKKKNKKLIFAVQEHHAGHLHYDFRLELEGVLKSWAVPKGPSLDPKDKRLAVQTEDHPLNYAKFHGTIPKGEYGAGEVFIWDSGIWECKQGEDPVEAIKKGRLEFTLKGKKLKGGWVLIRTHYRGNVTGKNWLLIKRHDEKEVTQDEASNWPGFIPPQLPRLVSLPPEEGDWIHEMKFDGYRIQTHIQNSVAKLYTRKELEWSNKFPHILEAIGKLKVKNAILDGEIVAMDSEGKSHFQQLQNSLADKEDKNLRYYVFDLLYLNGEDFRERPLLERKALLKKILPTHSKHIIYSEHLETKGEDFYQISCEHKLEGIVSKLADAPYSSGRNDLWVKTKCAARQEFFIGGFTDPKGSRAGFGSLLLGVMENGKLRYSGMVGTGFNEFSLKQLTKKLKTLEQEESPFEINSPRSARIHWVSPELLCEVSFSNWTDERIVREGVFHGLREDITKEQVIHEVPKEHFTMTSPEKIIFKKEKITKEQVAKFYERISESMLPYLADRPLSLVRCPNGSEGSCFFQKHVSGHIPEAFHTFPIKKEKFLTINSTEGLLELVQLNAFEIHAWNCHKDNYMRPDQIVMDFDPGPRVPWKKVIAATFELKEILEDLNLKSFVKLTGGKGLHVHIPVAPIYEWDQIKSFAHSLALEMVSRRPERYVAKMSKHLRKDKIFIDYLRNGYGATAVVPYSLRAKPLSTVALPLEWKELKKTNGPQDFTMEKVLQKLKRRKSDPWEGYFDLDQKIEILKPAKKAE